MKPPRRPWASFPLVWIHAGESQVKQHTDYWAAKTGDALAAARLVRSALDRDKATSMKQELSARRPILVSAHAYERDGVNAIPEVLADELSAQLGWPVDHGVVQTNMVAHTGADGFARLARQPAFDGVVESGADYLMVDDFIGMGGTLANLRGYIETHGGHVVGAVVLTGKPYSARLALTPGSLNDLREKHGTELEHWWQQRFGHAFDALTESEARYLVRTESADIIRNRIAAQKQAGDC